LATYPGTALHLKFTPNFIVAEPIIDRAGGTCKNLPHAGPAAESVQKYDNLNQHHRLRCFAASCATEFCTKRILAGNCLESAIEQF
jgi:hypothetical protein